MLPISPLFASIITKIFFVCSFLHKDESNFIPSGPSCSNNAIWGFIAGINPTAASKSEKQNFSTFPTIFEVLVFTSKILGIF